MYSEVNWPTLNVHLITTLYYHLMLDVQINTQQVCCEILEEYIMSSERSFVQLVLTFECER